METIVIVVNGACDDRLLNEALEEAGFASCTEYRRDFSGEPSRLEATAGGASISPQGVFRCSDAMTSVSVQTYKPGGLTLEQIKAAHRIMLEQVRRHAK